MSGHAAPDDSTARVWNADEPQEGDMVGEAVDADAAVVRPPAPHHNDHAADGSSVATCGEGAWGDSSAAAWSDCDRACAGSSEAAWGEGAWPAGEAEELEEPEGNNNEEPEEEEE